jgi:hypothetical protein
MYLHVFYYQHEIQKFHFHHCSFKLALSCWIVSPFQIRKSCMLNINKMSLLTEISGVPGGIQTPPRNSEVLTKPS